ncbi:2'-5' RNA ligase superfamily-domain-containing protein [Lentinula aff. lateritia]|uniref:2'-5' RNA ligase superfamily-domain-containing protein n=1 Tax=Lentinula aff. lateritia TaxID=2804960 RepID=A0ACC1TY78_9AGAR|nr:2'-5' RNA ligase superfamily-domain-containing protein [Lentinula aff. lateritia]
MDHPNITYAANGTAFVLIPPPELTQRLNQFRLVHDKSAPRWTAHITLHFSFVEVSHFTEVINAIEKEISQLEPFSFKFDGVGHFALQGYETVHLSVSDDANIRQLWSVVAKALNYTGRPLTPHLTIGQAPHNDPAALYFLRRKAQKILESVSSFEWPVRSISILKKDENDGGTMKRCHELYIARESQSSYVLPPWFPTVHHDNTSWKFCDQPMDKGVLPSTLSIATYNILHDDRFPISNRLPYIIQAIVSSNADIICLQEVTDESLPVILSSTSIHSRFKYSSRHPDIVLENERNILILSRFPFSWDKLDIGGKHKPAFIATFLNHFGWKNSKFVLAATHLSRASPYMEKKTAEMEALINHLRGTYFDADWVIAGDINWPERIGATPADELFEDCGLAIPHEPTFNPSTNPLAAATMQTSPDSQRYDRVYVKRMGGWAPQNTQLFGNGDSPPSDHHGLVVVFQRRVVPTRIAVESDLALGAESHPIIFLPPTSKLTTTELIELTRAQSWLPSAEQERKMSAVVETLRSLICPSSVFPTTKTGNVQIRIECVGSYALGVHTSTSDVDCLAVGTISSSNFWALMKHNLRRNAKALENRCSLDVRLERFVKDAVVQMMDLEVGGVKVDLQYCPARGLVGEEWEIIQSLPTDSPAFLLPHSSLVTLNAYRDILTILKFLQPESLLSAFRTAHRAIKLYIVAQGLFGSRFGFLGGFHLTILLSRVALTLVSSGGLEALESHHLVRQFFLTYSHWNWERDAVTAIPYRDVESGPVAGVSRRSSTKAAMVVLSIERPSSNLASNASRNSVEVMRRAFQKADRMLEECRNWAEVCGLEPEGGAPYQVFLKQHRVFIKLDIHFWGRSNLKGRAVIGWLESRIVSLLVQLYTAVPSINVRFWPVRFADAETIDSTDDARNPHGFYLFGLSPFSSASPSKLQETELASITQCIRSFEAELQGNIKYYDSQTTFISLGIMTQKSLEKETGLANIIPDSFTWSDNGFDLVDDDEDDAEEKDDEFDIHDREQPMISASQRKKALAASKRNKATLYTPTPGKLRTSADVMNRLLWDPVLGQNEYIVGYEDRFLGLQELKLRDWVMKEVEHESFIPQHRIVYFKHLTDGEMVWDKRKKIDTVFGSGLGSG